MRCSLSLRERENRPPPRGESNALSRAGGAPELSRTRRKSEYNNWDALLFLRGVLRARHRRGPGEDSVGMARVVLENLSKIFVSATGNEVRAVQRLNLVIEDKELLVLVGPSGSGKTTTLRLIAGLEEITEGAVSIDGEVVNDMPAKDHDIAMVFQNFALYPHLTVFQNLAFGLTLRKFPKADIQQRVKEAAEMLGLA